MAEAERSPARAPRAPSAGLVVARLQLLRLARRPWVVAFLAAGIVLAAVVAAVAAPDSGQERLDSLREGAAALLLLGGLALAVGLGSGALNKDGDSGHMGLLLGGGATRAQLATGAIGARLAALLAIVACWGLALQAASAALGLGLDGPLAIHTLAVVEALVLTLLATAAASAVVGPVAAGAFGLIVYVAAQGMANVKAAVDLHVITGATGLVDALYHVLPQVPTSPMISNLQARDHGGVAAPQIDINGVIAYVPASGWDTILWGLLWCAIFAGLCYTGLRRRPVN
jgi:ABC-2 family transporter